MTDIILLISIVAIVGAAVAYIIREKRKGTVCIGCPHAQSCGGHCSGGGQGDGCTCQQDTDNKS